MTIWVVRYLPGARADPSGVDGEGPRFRIHPEDDPQSWIVETNPNLPPEIQKHTAFLIAEFLSDMMGI